MSRNPNTTSTKIKAVVLNIRRYLQKASQSGSQIGPEYCFSVWLELGSNQGGDESQPIADVALVSAPRRPLVSEAETSASAVVLTCGGGGQHLPTDPGFVKSTRASVTWG